MKKETIIMAVVTILSFLLITILPCQADNVIYICKNNKTGTPRFVNAPNKCKSSESLLTLSAQQNTNPLPNFTGDLCWQFAPTFADPAVPNFILKLGVFWMGGGHYLLSGLAGHGNAEIDGNNILGTLTVSAAGGGAGGNDMMIGTYNITLDISTFGGTLAAIAHNHEDTDGLTTADHNYFKGTMTFIPCP